MTEQVQDTQQVPTARLEQIEQRLDGLNERLADRVDLLMLQDVYQSARLTALETLNAPTKSVGYDLKPLRELVGEWRAEGEGWKPGDPETFWTCAAEKLASVLDALPPAPQALEALLAKIGGHNPEWWIELRVWADGNASATIFDDGGDRKGSALTDTPLAAVCAAYEKAKAAEAKKRSE
jgi:hypothetical protein